MKVIKDKLIERLRRILAEKNISAYTAGRIMQIEARTLYRWLGNETRPKSKVYRDALKKGIKRIEKI